MSAACLALGLLLGPFYLRSSAAAVDDLTGPWQLLVDDFLVATMTNVVRTYHRFQKHAGNPVLVADKPWEGTIVYIYGTVLPNEVQLTVISERGASVTVFRSSNLVQWASFTNLVNTSGTTQVTDMPPANQAQLFYRLQTL